MHLTVLGSGNGVPSATRGCPGYLLRGAGETVLVDPGPGSLVTAARRGVSAGEVTGVLISHLHIDRHLDLLALLFARRSGRFRDGKTLRVHGPVGLLRVFSLWKEAYGHWIDPEGYFLEVAESGPWRGEMGALLIEAVAVPHGSRPSLGWRIREREDGPLLAYSGDTGEGPGAVAAGKGADLFVLECTLPEGAAPEKHLTASAAGRVAAASGCRRLLLVHLAAEVEGTSIEPMVRASYQGPLALASDGTEADI
jgi:ribonuclease BN (tRNA processing enzyme)